MAQDNSDGTENRANERASHQAEVSLHLTDATLRGTSENLSSAGIMLVTEDDLCVSVEFQGPEGSTLRKGRIVRVQRMDASQNGLAVEFDPE